MEGKRWGPLLSRPRIMRSRGALQRRIFSRSRENAPVVGKGEKCWGRKKFLIYAYLDTEFATQRALTRTLISFSRVREHMAQREWFTIYNCVCTPMHTASVSRRRRRQQLRSLGAAEKLPVRRAVAQVQRRGVAVERTRKTRERNRGSGCLRCRRGSGLVGVAHR